MTDAIVSDVRYACRWLARSPGFALIAICSLGISSWAVLTLNGPVDDIVRAGSLGILYFAAAFILQNISRRMMRSEALATSRARSIAELEQINQQIIQPAARRHCPRNPQPTGRHQPRCPAYGRIPEPGHRRSPDARYYPAAFPQGER